MQDIRSGNMSVVNMKKEIYQSIYILKNRPTNKRSMRQIIDGDKFLSMINTYPYYNCKTVSELKKSISEQRNKLKEELKSTEKYVTNYQLSLFETYEEVSESTIRQIRYNSIQLEDEIRWLHKCLGMCSNRNYFK